MGCQCVRGSEEVSGKGGTEVNGFVNIKERDVGLTECRSLGYTKQQDGEKKDKGYTNVKVRHK